VQFRHLAEAVMFDHTSTTAGRTHSPEAAVTKRLAAALTLLVVTAATPLLHAAARQVRHEVSRITPRDDSAADPEFLSFKSRLLTAARAGDTKALLAMMAPDVSYSYEPTTGEFILAHYDVAPGRPWYALVRALELGVAGDGIEYSAPFIARVGLDDVYAVIVGAGVRLRSSPDDRARVIGTLSAWEVVSLDMTHRYDSELVERSAHPSRRSAWVRVKTADGRDGYVYGLQVVSAHNTRFTFRKNHETGEWLLVSMAAGAG
jgi:hypothetical protein